MKSKKKLIYKLHQNMQQNPFKHLQQKSMRNAGIQSYDFNRLKHARTLSLHGLNSINAKNILYNDIDSKKTLQIRASQACILPNKKVFKSLIKVNNFQRNDKNDELSSKKMQISKQINKTQQINESHQRYQCYCGQPDETLKQYYDHINEHQRIIKNQKNVYFPALKVSYQKLNTNILDQQRAQFQVLQQIRSVEQQKMNKQILMLMRKNSFKNLERLARSQSQVLKIDKWKQKYGRKQAQQKINDQNSKKSPLKKILLPLIDKKRNQKIAYWTEVQPARSKQFGKLQKQIMQANQLNSFQIEEKCLKYFQQKNNRNEANLEKEQKLSSEFEDYFSSQLGKKYSTNIQPNNFENRYSDSKNEDQKDQLDHLGKDIDNFHSIQPIKITITKLKKHERKNRQNLNLQNKNNKNQNQKIKSQQKQAISQTQRKAPFYDQKQTFEETWKRQFQECQAQQQKQKPVINAFSIKSKILSTFLNKNEQNEQFANKDIVIKAHINQDNLIFRNLIEGQVPMQWQNKRGEDYEDLQFGNFVDNQNQS